MVHFVTLALTLLPPAAQAQPSRESGKALYGRMCASCHGATGQGDGVAGVALPVKPSSFGTPAFWSGRTDESLRKVIVEGGAAVGKSPLMAPFGASLSADEVSSLVLYLKTFAPTPAP